MWYDETISVGCANQKMVLIWLIVPGEAATSKYLIRAEKWLSLNENGNVGGTFGGGASVRMVSFGDYHSVVVFTFVYADAVIAGGFFVRPSGRPHDH